MNTLRQALYGLALLGALALFIWSQQLRIAVANQTTELAQKDTQTAREDAARNLSTATTLRNSLNEERQAQSQLRGLHDDLRQGLAKGDYQSITVGFTGRVARIARVHQYGLKDRAEASGPEVRYKQRELLGFTEADLEVIRDGLLAQLAP